MDNNTLALVLWDRRFFPSTIPNPLLPSLSYSKHTLQFWLVSSLWSRAFASILAILAPFMVTYLVMLLQWEIALKNQGKIRKPPIVPYCVPLLGHALSFLWDPANLATSIV